MRTSTKILLSLGAVGLVATGITLATSRKVQSQAKKYHQKKELKKFVSENLNDNPTFYKIVDELSNQELEALTNVLAKVSERRKNIHVEGLNVHDMKEEVKKIFVRFMDNMAVA